MAAPPSPNSNEKKSSRRGNASLRAGMSQPPVRLSASNYPEGRMPQDEHVEPHNDRTEPQDKHVEPQNERVEPEDNRVFGSDGFVIEGYYKRSDGEIRKVGVNRGHPSDHRERPEYGLTNARISEYELRLIRADYDLIGRLPSFVNNPDGLSGVRLSLPEVDNLNRLRAAHPSLGSQVPRGNLGATMERRLEASQKWEASLEKRRQKGRLREYMKAKGNTKLEMGDKSDKREDTNPGDESDGEWNK